MTAALPLFHAAYGPALDRLPRPIVHVHGVHEARRWSGRADCMHGDSVAARMLCRVLGFPPSGCEVPLEITMVPAPGGGEVWTRMFGAFRMRAFLRAGRETALIEETLWPFTAVSRMEPDSSGVTQRLVGLRLGPLPLPRALWPALSVRESAEGTRYGFSITVHLPWQALLAHYEGWLETEEK